MDNISIFRYIFKNNIFIIYNLEDDKFEKLKIELIKKSSSSIFENNYNHSFILKLRKNDSLKLIKKLYGNNQSKKTYLNYEVELLFLEKKLKTRYGFSYNSLRYFIIVLLMPIFLLISSLINLESILLLISVTYYIILDFIFNCILLQHKKEYNNEFCKVSNLVIFQT